MEGSRELPGGWGGTREGLCTSLLELALGKCLMQAAFMKLCCFIPKLSAA